METSSRPKAPSQNQNPGKELKIDLKKKAFQNSLTQSASYGFSQPITDFDESKTGPFAAKKKVAKPSKDSPGKRVSKVIITSLLEPTASQLTAKTQAKRKQVSKLSKISQQMKPKNLAHDQPRGSMTEAAGAGGIYLPGNPHIHYLKQPKLGASLRPVSLSDLSAGLLSGRSDHVRVSGNPKNPKDKTLHVTASSQKLAVSQLRSSGGRFLTDCSRDTSLIRNLPFSEYSQKNLPVQKYSRLARGAVPQSVRVVSSAKNQKGAPKKRSKKDGDQGLLQASISQHKTVACADPELGREKSPPGQSGKPSGTVLRTDTQSSTNGANSGTGLPSWSTIPTSATKTTANSEVPNTKQGSPKPAELQELEAQLARERRYFTDQLAAKDEYIRDLQAKLERASKPTVIQTDC